jgi:glutamate formiminotransferase
MIFFSLMQALIECVPNFSEGRDSARLDAIIAAMEAPGVFVLRREMDHDHNRSVVTLAGEPEAVEEAAIRGVGKAAELIDLSSHRGVHPRMGAADVVPFIPMEGLTLEDCIIIARRAGAEIWKRYQVPVYLYEAAASSPARRALENVRRGQFEGLRAEVSTNLSRKPDFGGFALHPTAGAVAVGARKFLIAYNIFLHTPDVEAAKQVAKAVRFSSGGLPFVKASGFLVKGLAQVSMNLTDFEQMPIWRVFQRVQEEASRLGVSVNSGELIGLIPRKALESAPSWFLESQSFDASQILENRLASAMADARTRHGVAG